jgi:hypothetical protein
MCEVCMCGAAIIAARRQAKLGDTAHAMARIPRLLLLLLVLAAPAIAAAVSIPPPAAVARCGKSTTFCPAANSCCAQPYSPSKFGCRASNSQNVSEGCGDSVAAEVCCKPGPGQPASTSLPNCLVIGDSVSIGYTDMGGIQRVQSHLKGACQVQHGPWDVSDGGAGSTALGVTCLDHWLRTQAQVPVKWDVIQFK